MGVLDGVHEPSDLRALGPVELAELADEIRRFLVEKVSATGGHLGPNLGVVELTLAIHRVFDSPRDPVIFDTGHQAYVHKMVTGRADRFDSLRKEGGLSGYPSRSESEHDWVESSHASASLSYADGLAKAFELTGRGDRHVVAVVGDGALTGGMCWEALNNIAAGKDRSVVIVVNDNGRSYSPTIGGLADHLATLRLQPNYERALDTGRHMVKNLPVVGSAAYAMLHGMKAGLKDAISPQVMFTDLGIKYLGPVDGHDQAALESALRRAKAFGGPVIVHAVTRKGMGYSFAENDVADQMHSTGVIDPLTGLATSVAAPDWTSEFSRQLIALGTDREDVVAITAAMAGPTGLAAFGEVFPDRFFDVGIAEQHALTSAAGLALGGLHPVVAIYSTFLNRAFDQLLMDVALLNLPVTLVLDRAGVTGSDGASHNGMWDMSLLGIVPNMRVAAPRDGATLREELAEALAVSDGPTALRFPKGAIPDDIEAVRRLDDSVDVLHEPEGESDVLLVAVGPFASLALDTARELAADGVSATVVDPRWVLPVPDSLVKLAADFRLVVTLEDSGLHGGIGASVSAALRAGGVDVPCRDLGVPQQFLDHSSRDRIHADIGLTPSDIAGRVRGWIAHRPGDI
ncbi:MULTISPECIES: 1-deoxy-D-xylulose-5-phosphate synthase [unclassified Rhodococcus (in: high G+C Gram-positive bacteria)]|uniref:1-deoxy-D-xylulose-5-phosphate synthase n=1 Tax=unclassified Rhodococcus (in: high G+C Gram-positive bacteria) TaxID=192944 RepID=UPI00048128BE|nr:MULTISPECIES: 1-deoxy-D-xylulose-5-phosphate synthase [unclassified Rhodococcus (in: high G+C Gram-positive bacteria)]KQU34686.1 1-deoxy-D-xylulose-5-phosphate synthase [Rhodococcus sp. Leaf225]KQU45448.1 1-deoxy-D-xylulose-5-phosphate synthase [Rhodococcus sp. Leaf258]MBY6679741.1 1-deoxy-D-xylulose-5-phosphate synthase [Rhodococcus sp. BP-316]MBY6687125.1 1-deoxy-D-xylulose-5-phosphate synthase [Rhodococcus sp. BP-288]MBY6693822.1 1-deoxy-D-xylulose-5-phosphate synthase [Rhodococcus sp. B